SQPLTGTVSAVSVGIVGGVPLLDLAYEEDVRAETDMNVVCTGDGRFVEVQGTAEGQPFDRTELDALLALAVDGCAQLTAAQKPALAAHDSGPPHRLAPPGGAGPRGEGPQAGNPHGRTPRVYRCARGTPPGAKPGRATTMHRRRTAAGGRTARRTAPGTAT